ncbi:hypothetical protein N0V85_002327 [Neurospora sp. IMI 360204]|nr:hypothetical protein N0V85_002327 [Neurospora sp. IMI 360204]
MDRENQSSRPEQAPLERFPPEVAEINSKYHMDGSSTIETRQISGVDVSFGPGMEVLNVAPKMTGFPSCKAECKKVNLYWDRQWFKYTIRLDQDPSRLLTIHTLFLSGKIQVRGKPVATNYISSGPGDGTLELLNLSPNVIKEEIKEQIPHALLKGAKWSPKHPKCTDGSALRNVLSLLTQFGPLKDQYFEPLPTMMRVTALFQNEDDARRAVEVLNQSPLPFDPQQMLIARLEYQMELKGPEEWVQNIPGQLLSKASISRNIHLIKLALSLDVEPRFSLSGESREVLVEAMEWVRKLPVSGQIHNEKSRSRDFTTTDESCVICGDTAELPVITQCKHVYCANCFDNLCSSTFSIGSWRNKAICQAPKPSGTSTALDNSICGCTLPLPELQSLLKPSTFERLLIASFKSYVHRHPDKLQNCPTTNCDYIYFVIEPCDQPDRHSDNPATAPHITCPHCLADICTRCQEGHAARGMTCLEFQDHLAHGAHSIALAKAEQGIKDCPKCTTFLVKVDGCNHVTCPVCNTHLCWKCLEMFRGEDAADRVYMHLDEVHDGIYDYLPDEEDEEDLGDEEYLGDEEDLDDDDDDWEQNNGFGDPEALRMLAHLLGRMHRQAVELLGRLQREAEELRRITGNFADPDFEEGQGERANTGQENNGDDGEGAGVNGEDAANHGIEIEDDQSGWFGEKMGE